MKIKFTLIEKNEKGGWEIESWKRVKLVGLISMGHGLGLCSVAGGIKANNEFGHEFYLESCTNMWSITNRLIINCKFHGY